MRHLEVLFAAIQSKVRAPVAILMGSPRDAAVLAGLAPAGPVSCFQIDLHQAERLREELTVDRPDAMVECRADVWDLPAEYQTVLFPVAMHGEREFKLDLLEQCYHILRPRGLLLALSEYRRDVFLPKALKKLFGKCSEMPSTREGSIFWAAEDGPKARRRHEVSFHARIGDGPSHAFLSRPGVFSYGCMDDGARALLEAARIEPGNAVLDLGCGVGTNGILAADPAGLDASITFVDSNMRAVALAEINARANGLTNFQTRATACMEELPEAAFDVILANPPYYATSSIAKMFIEQSKPLLREQGRFYLVTKQVEHVAPAMVEIFGEVDAYELRGYTVIEATRRSAE